MTRSSVWSHLDIVRRVRVPLEKVRERKTEGKLSNKNEFHFCINSDHYLHLSTWLQRITGIYSWLRINSYSAVLLECEVLFYGKSEPVLTAFQHERDRGEIRVKPKIISVEGQQGLQARERQTSGGLTRNRTKRERKWGTNFFHRLSLPKITFTEGDTENASNSPLFQSRKKEDSKSCTKSSSESRTLQKKVFQIFPPYIHVLAGIFELAPKTDIQTGMLLISVTIRGIVCGRNSWQHSSKRLNYFQILHVSNNHIYISIRLRQLFQCSHKLTLRSSSLAKLAIVRIFNWKLIPPLHPLTWPTESGLFSGFLWR